MSVTVAAIVERIEDPGTPVIWVDPSIPGNIWEGLPEALEGHGYRVLDLDAEESLFDRPAVMARLAMESGLTGPVSHTISTLRQHLLGIPSGEENGWVILYRDPGPLRRSDEGGFEEIIDLLQSVHERRWSQHHKAFKLIVTD